MYTAENYYIVMPPTKKRTILHNESPAFQLSWHGNKNSFPCTTRPWNVPI